MALRVVSFFVPLPSRAISLARGHSRVSRFARRTTEKRETARSLGFSRLINFMPFSQNSPANQHNQHVQPTASTPTSTILQVSSVARNLCKEGNRDHLRMENHHHVNSCNRHCCLKARGGSTPIHYLYRYVPPNGVVILKLLI